MTKRELGSWALCRNIGCDTPAHGHDTAQGRAVTLPLGPRYDRPRPRYGWAKACDTTPLRVSACGLSAPCTRPGSAGCALGVPNQFLTQYTIYESLFGTLFINTVHKIFRKKKEIKFLKNKIKSNKMR